MSYEIEQKFRTNDHEAVARRLLNLGAQPSTTIEQADVYLNHPSRDFAATHEAFRLRRVGDSNALTYKGPKRAGPTKTREEIEIGYDRGPTSFADMLRMLVLLGFRTVAEVRKSRTAYTMSYDGLDVEIVLDDADRLGTFVEIEVIAEDDGAIEKAQAAVVSVARELHLEEIENRSYLRMLLELKAASTDD